LQACSIVVVKQINVYTRFDQISLVPVHHGVDGHTQPIGVVVALVGLQPAPRREVWDDGIGGYGYHLTNFLKCDG